jgi:hypothetical protein
MAGKKGNYSNIIVYDERRRYYYMWPQKNKPFLDDEIRDMGVGLLDQVRRSVQHIYGDVAAPYSDFSGFFSTAAAFQVEQATDSIKNFKIAGGSLDHPTALYAKGFYIFLAEDLEYKHQMYASDTIDIHSQYDKSLTLTPIPAISTPSTSRLDIVYVHLHFEEVSAASGTDSDVYRDTGLKNPVVGTETANRLRAVIDIRVRENWTTQIDKNIFTHAEFLGNPLVTGAIDPTSVDFKVPIAVIYRDAFRDTIEQADIVDLLTLYNKRSYTLEETSYRLNHGGYTPQDVLEKGLTGFNAQFHGAIYDEGAFATGLNQGLGTEALNTNSVTPRILDNNGKFFMRSLMVGHDTGIIKYETGPEALGAGELVAKDISARSVYAGYGVTGITGIREYKDSLNVVVRGETGKGGLSVRNMDGATGSKTLFAGAVRSGKLENFFVQDYRGRIGLNTLTPGWDTLPSEWGVERYNDGLLGATGVNILADINGSLRVRNEAFVDKDLYVFQDTYGRTWRIPSLMSSTNPAMFGFTGITSEGFTGIANSVAEVLFRRGIAVVGDTGIVGYGYTGIGSAGQYESYDADGRRVFTIGDLGDDFDRVVKTLYGTASRGMFTSDKSFLALSDGTNVYGQVAIGDIVSYDIVITYNSTQYHVTGSLTLTSSGMSGVEEIKNDILSNPGFPAGYTRAFTYTFYNTDGSTELRTGTAYGVQIVEDPFGFSMGFDNHGRIVLKNIPESPVLVELESIASFTVSRNLFATISVSFTAGSYYGAVEYGGALQNLKFAKLDLGEAADAWLFNGDVFFNGGGNLDRVTFSPNVIFRNDVFAYGTLFSDQQFINFANVQNLVSRNNVIALNNVIGENGVIAGAQAVPDFDALKAVYPDLLVYAKGTVLSQSMVLRNTDADVTNLGTLYLTSKREGGAAYAYLGCSVDSTEVVPFGIHLVDDRPGVADENRFMQLTLDASDGHGNARDVRLNIKGDLKTDRYCIANFLGVGDIENINTDYKFQVNGRAQINDVLEVKALRFIGAEAPEGNQDIQTPQNITVIGAVSATTSPNGEEVQNNQVILREKKFTSNKRIYLDNSAGLGITTPFDPLTQDYYVEGLKNSYFEPQPGYPEQARWAHDNVSYTENQFNTIETTLGSTSPDEIIINNIEGATLEKYKKYKCERITIASLGTLFIEWQGYKYDPLTTFTDSAIQAYYFQSPYFRNRDGGQTLDWFPGNSRFGDDNLIVKVEGSLTDTNSDIPSIYTIGSGTNSGALGLYIPKSSWQQYGTPIGEAAQTGYRSFALYYPYDNRVNNLNVMSFNVNNISSANPYTTPGWKLAVYPRLIKQTRVPVGTNYDKIYRGEWDLDLVILPDYAPGRVANMVGKLRISYMQS